MKMCQAFSRNGHEVTLLAPDAKGEYECEVEDIYDYYGINKSFTVMRLPFVHPKENSLLFLITTALYCAFIFVELARVKPDLVYGRYVSGCYLGAKMGIRTIFESHAPIWTSRLEKVVFRKLIRSKHFERLIVVSDALKDMYVTTGLLRSNRIQVAHDSADEVQDFEQVKDWPRGGGNLQIGYFGSLYAGRGIRLMMEIASVLKEVDFHIIGGTAEDVARVKADCKLPNVYIHGHVAPKDVHKYMNSCDVLLAAYQSRVAVMGGGGDTSKFMSPLKIFEYMSCKKAIIASDLPVLREVLNESNAILVTPDDIKAWITAIRMTENDTLRKQLGEAAYNTFLRNYTWDIRATKVIL
jgi:glycosyltransferase involved in cell wall biosynthesis